MYIRIYTCYVYTYHICMHMYMCYVYTVLRVHVICIRIYVYTRHRCAGHWLRRSFLEAWQRMVYMYISCTHIIHTRTDLHFYTYLYVYIHHTCAGQWHRPSFLEARRRMVFIYIWYVYTYYIYVRIYILTHTYMRIYITRVQDIDSDLASWKPGDSWC